MRCEVLLYDGFDELDALAPWEVLSDVRRTRDDLDVALVTHEGDAPVRASHGAVITPQLMGLEKTQQLPYASSLCGACREVCPVKIDIPRLLLHLRSEITEKSAPNVTSANPRTGERLAFKVWQATMTRPWL